MPNNDNIFDLLERAPINDKTIYFEGSDYSGKTTLIKKFTREGTLGSRNFLSSRGFPSNIIYGDLFKRDFNRDSQVRDFKNQLESNKSLFLFLIPEFDEIQKRSQRGDDYIENAKLYELWQNYRNFFSEYTHYANILWISGDATLKDSQKWKSDLLMSESEIVFDWKILLHSLINQPRKSQNSKFLNYKLDYSFSRDELARELELVSSEYEQLSAVPSIVKKENFAETYKKDSYDREMMFSQLLFNSHIQLDVYKEPLISRRFLATNNTSCISLIQFNVDQNELNMTVTFRSSDVANLLLFDISFILESALNFENFLKFYPFKELLPDFEHFERYNFSINIANAHVNFNS